MTAVLRIAVRLLLWSLPISPLVRTLRGRKRAPSESFAALWMGAVLVTTLLGVLSLSGALWAAPLFAVGLVVVMPWPVTRHLLIPLGMSRSARLLSSLDGWTWGTDLHGGGLVAGAWATLRQKVPNRDRMAELEAARDQAATLTAAQVLATGLLAAARGDQDGARTLLDSVDELGVETTAAMVHKLAREWLVADAAARGDWAGAARLAGGRRPGPRTRITRLLGAVGARLAYPPEAPSGPLSAVQLWALWLVAPRRRHTLAWVRRALAVARPGSAAVPAGRRLETSLAPDPYGDALSTHVFALSRDPATLDIDTLERLATMWDRALAAPDTRALILQRAAALGVRHGDRAVRALSDQVARDLAELARAAGAPLAGRAPSSLLLSEAQRWLRDELLSELELAFAALQARVADQRALSSLDEWREWLSLRALYTRAAAVGGLELRRLAFPHVHPTACKLAVWLWNDRREYLMANAMFRWLLDEALAVGDAEAIELQSKNWDEAL